MKSNLDSVILQKRGTKKLIMLILIVVLFFSILLSPLLTINNIIVNGISKYTPDEILNKINISKGLSLLSFNYFRSKSILKSDPYIESVSFSIKYPIEITINIDERKLRGYVPYMGAYLYIDEYGNVLECQTYFKERRPIVLGLNFDHFSIGKKLEVKNEESFDVILKIEQLMVKYDLLSDIIQVDASDPNDIHIFIREIDVSIGSMSDCDEKIRTMKEIIKSIPEGDRGFLDIKDISIPPIFKYLT